MKRQEKCLVGRREQKRKSVIKIRYFVSEYFELLENTSFLEEAVYFPVVELPVVKLPEVELPVVELSVVKLPMMKLSVVELPVVDFPVVQFSVVELAVVYLSGVELSVVLYSKTVISIETFESQASGMWVPERKELSVTCYMCGLTSTDRAN